MSRNRTSSKFAWLTAPGSSPRPVHDIVILENDHFVALPSLGSIVPGWMLIVPRRPMTTLSLMTDEERRAIAEIRAEICFRLQIYGREIFQFEHGGSIGSVVSCGVDQAHLHVVPLKFDLVSAAGQFDFGWEICGGITSLSEKQTRGQEYLFVEHSDYAIVGFPKSPVSQWFRRLIAQNYGVMEWDYKANPNLDRVQQTARELARLKRATKS